MKAGADCAIILGLFQYQRMSWPIWLTQNCMATNPPRQEVAPERPTRSRVAGLDAFTTAKLYRDFRFVWAGNFVAIGAQWLQLFTIGWLVHHITGGNAVLTGTVVGIRTLPVLLVGPWAGVLADRLDRRKVVMVTQAVMAVAAALFAFLVIASDLDAEVPSGPLRWWHPFVYMTIAGVAHCIIQPVRQAMVANTVPRNALASALALNGMVYPSTRVIAPAIGGLLVATLGFKWNFFIEAVLYLVIVLLLVPVRLPYRANGPRRHASAWSSLLDGLRYVRGEKRILQLIVMSLIPNFVFQPLIYVLPVFTTEVLNRDVDVGGLLAAAVGVGGVIAAFFIALVGYVVKKGWAVFFGLATGCAFILMFAQSQWLWVSYVMLAGLGFSQYVFRVANSTLLQTVVPDDLRGRVMSIYMLDHGISPLATLLIGIFISLWNPSGAFTVIAALALAVSLLMTLAFRSTRELE